MGGRQRLPSPRQQQVGLRIETMDLSLATVRQREGEVSRRAPGCEPHLNDSSHGLGRSVVLGDIVLLPHVYGFVASNAYAEESTLACLGSCRGVLFCAHEPPGVLFGRDRLLRHFHERKFSEMASK